MFPSTRKYNPFLKRNKAAQYRSIWECLHIDFYLFLGLAVLASIGILVLYSAGNKSIPVLQSQLIHLGVASTLMLIVAQIHPKRLQHWAPWFFTASLIMLAAVLVVGQSDKGAQRWLSLGFLRFQPSELMKIAIPLMLASYFENKSVPPRLDVLAYGCGLILIPVLLTLKQPDLGTAILLGAAGFSVVFLAGIRWRIIGIAGISFSLMMPFLWMMLHQYQRQRVLTFINPERDPLGAGYHIIQSKIAIGSGGLFGKGWLEGTQSHLQFLPEHSTDFIFAVFSEEFGFAGNLILMLVYSLIVLRCSIIAMNAQDMFSRLLGGSITMIFFLSFFINIGMVCGMLPVVGIPLPLISYGGTSMLTLLAGFGILMSIQTHKKLMG